jgi:hypothetical protein
MSSVILSKRLNGNHMPADSHESKDDCLLGCCADVYRRLRGACCLHHQGDEEDSKLESPDR